MDNGMSNEAFQVYHQQEIARLQAQRDELLAALKVAVRVMEAFEIGVDAEIRAAIASSEDHR